jgi:UDP-N-acetylmuramoyl-L-alanyl-D-glutamate--2,6-diaminopimelate ligase
VTGLLTGLDGAAPTGADVEVTDIVYDSREARPDTVFVALRGAVADGHDFAAAAAQAGCAALVVERQLDNVDVPQWIVGDTRLALAVMSARYFDDPSRGLSLAGITGTNGKTTTAYMLDAVYRAAGFTSGLIGTVEYRIGDETVPVTRTTPESYELQKLLRRMVDAGVKRAVMEVSSHAVAQQRVAAVSYAARTFTNLTQDHLDYHGDMESYFTAKRSFFAGEGAPAIINTDDEYGRRLADGLPHVFTYGVDRRADYQAKRVAFDLAGATFTLVAPDGEFKMKLPVPGAFNIMNSLAAAATARQQAIGWPAIIAGLRDLRQVPGRFERVDGDHGFAVIVDYAHTPDSLRRAVEAARAATAGRVITVFGCGGDRDRGKRPLMGEAASAGSDVTIITSDNPRSEDPEAIIADIKAGIAGPCETVPDRREAIELAVRVAKAGDVVLIAGKGHEREQIFADKTVAFDDKAVAEEVLKEMAKA